MNNVFSTGDTAVIARLSSLVPETATAGIAVTTT